MGDQVNVTQSMSGDSNICSGTGNVTVNYNMPPEWMQYAEEFSVTKAALASFFRILEEQQVSRGDLDSKLREIAFRYKELLLRFEAVTSDDPQVQALKEQARQAIENGDYDRADALLNQAKERDRAAVATLKASLAEQQATLEKRQLSEAQSCVEQAQLQRLQYRYEKSAQYFQEAVAALPEGYKAERAKCLCNAGQDLNCIDRYAEALHLYEQSLSIFSEIDDLEHEALLLNSIGQVCDAQGDYGKSLEYLERSLKICRKVGTKEGEGATLGNISRIYRAKGDYPKALKYLERVLLLNREINSKKAEGTTLNNIGLILKQQRDYTTALKYYKQALAIASEIKDENGESTRLNNISQVYHAQEKYDDALEYAEQSLAIKRQIGDRRGEGTTLNNIGSICDAKGDYAAALKQYEHALAIAKEIGAKAEEAGISGNIGLLHKKQGNWPRPNDTSAGLWSCWSDLNIQSYKNGARYWRQFAPNCGSKKRPMPPAR